MSYKVYRTQAIVLRALPAREADRLLALYTAEFGLLFARAQGLRREASKMRYALTELSLADVALVRGKAGWRVTGAVPRHPAPSERPRLLALARIGALVTRLVHGEERNDALMGTLRASHEALQRGEDPALIEAVAVSRILFALGYVAPTEDDALLFSDDAFAEDALAAHQARLSQLVRRINQALAETHL
ncbi:MAG TPA: recombination protein O N-terminal domain-containing protein [Candidatus Paceibacterota bacterium]|nr:recombination protein O N-terminal domain-containing protein [Candidatus Paceibacterota bacterium]